MRDDVNELRKEFIKSKWSEKQFKEALRLQQISKKRELTDEEKKKFSDIVRFDLDDSQRAELEKNEDYIRKVLLEGVDKARAIACQTLDEVREAMNMKI